MFAPYRLLVLAIVLIALLGAVYYVLFETHTEKDPLTELLGALEQAEFLPGETIKTNEIFFESKSSIANKALESTERVVFFECLDGRICCDSKASCDKGVEWSPERISFKENRRISLSVKCELEYNLNVCTVSIGVS